jgi:hypothetical protein
MQRQQILPICATTGKHELNEDSDGKYRCTFCGKAANGYGMMCYSCEMLFDPSEVKDMFDHFEVCINARGDEEFSLYKVVPTLRDRASHKS